MSYIKLITGIERTGSKCIRLDTTYTKCKLKASNIDKLTHILGLYDTVEALDLTIDEPPENWKITRPYDTIKHICLDAKTKFCNRPNILPDNFWLMFPNLETIILLQVFIPVDNLDTLTNLTTFRLSCWKSKIKKTELKIQEIVRVLANMTTLTDIQIVCEQKCYIPDELFQNNAQLKYINFFQNVSCHNIPSILNCRELRRMCIKINVLTNPYILELTNMEQFKIVDIPLLETDDHSQNQMLLSEEMPDGPKILDVLFDKPIFTTCITKSCIIWLNSHNRQLTGKGPNYCKWLTASKLPIQPRLIANDNYIIGTDWYLV